MMEYCQWPFQELLDWRSLPYMSGLFFRQMSGNIPTTYLTMGFHLERWILWLRKKTWYNTSIPGSRSGDSHWNHQCSWVDQPYMAWKMAMFNGYVGLLEGIPWRCWNLLQFLDSLCWVNRRYGSLFFHCGATSFESETYIFAWCPRIGSIHDR